MKTEWSVKAVQFTQLEGELSAYSTQGWEVLTVMSLLEGWFGIVAKRNVSQAPAAKKGKK